MPATLVLPVSAIVWATYTSLAHIHQSTATVHALLDEARASWQGACEDADAAALAVRRLPTQLLWGEGSKVLQATESSVRAVGRLLLVW